MSSRSHARPKLNRDSSQTASIAGSAVGSTSRYDAATPTLSYTKSLSSRTSRSRIRTRTNSHSTRPLLMHHDSMPVPAAAPEPVPRRRHKSSSLVPSATRPPLQQVPSDYSYSQAGCFGKNTNQPQRRPSYGVLPIRGHPLASNVARQPLAGIFPQSLNKLPQPPALAPKAPSSHNGSDYSTKSAMKSRKKPPLRRAPSTVHFQPGTYSSDAV
jgi:hypothetical protein